MTNLLFFVYMGEYWQYYLLGIVLLPGLILASWAQAKTMSTYKKYRKVLSSKQITGAQAAEKILKAKGIFDVEVVRVSGSDLSDNYNPETKIVSPSPKVYDGTDIAALGIAAHECGHAIQHAEKYAPLRARSALVKVSNISSQFLWPLVIIGIIFNFAYVGGIWGNIFMWSGVAFFGISIIFSLITLPVEYNASKKALSLLVATDCVDAMEVKGAKKVLSAAALTYVAALVVSMLSLVRFLLFIFLNSRKD